MKKITFVFVLTIMSVVNAAYDNIAYSSTANPPGLGYNRAASNLSTNIKLPIYESDKLPVVIYNDRELPVNVAIRQVELGDYVSSTGHQHRGAVYTSSQSAFIDSYHYHIFQSNTGKRYELVISQLGLDGSISSDRFTTTISPLKEGGTYTTPCTYECNEKHITVRINNS